MVKCFEKISTALDPNPTFSVTIDESHTMNFRSTSIFIPILLHAGSEL